MPEKRTIERAKKDLRQGKSASTAAGEFVKEEIEHIREGKHGARSAKQAVAIGLSKARRAGIPLPFAGRRRRAKTRRTFGRIANRAFPPNPFGFSRAHRRRPLGCSKKGSTHQRSGRTLRRSPQSGSHTRTECVIFRVTGRG